MKIKYILAGALVAMFAVPGTASQLVVRGAMEAPLSAAPLTASTAGLFSDPDAAPRLSITLPTRFVATDIGTPVLQGFQG